MPGVFCMSVLLPIEAHKIGMKASFYVIAV